MRVPRFDMVVPHLSADGITMPDAQYRTQGRKPPPLPRLARHERRSGIAVTVQRRDTWRMDDDELEAKGLYDPAVDDPWRGDLVRRCLEIGLTVDEIRDAGDELIDRAIQRIHDIGDQRLTLADVADRAGVPASRVEQIARANGRLVGPGLDERIFSEHDVEAMSTIGPAFDLFGEDAALQMVRASAAAVARIGDAVISAFLTGVAAPAMRDDESGLQLLEANRAGAELMPKFGDMLTQMLRRYMQQSYRSSSDVSLTSALADGVDARQLAIGFADLVGSTTLLDGRSLADLSAALDAFERTATDTIAAKGGRVVKFIGDEVMFRADSADIACALAVDLVDAVRSDPLLPPLRVGVAFGEVLSREGDFYGPIVNLAARVTKLAPLHGVVVTLHTTDALQTRDEFTIHPLGAIEMQGLTDPVELAALASRPS
jgi:adenylate cyclase